MTYSRAQTIDFYFEEIESGKMVFSDLRKKLESQGLEKEEVSIVVRQVDSALQKAAKHKASRAVGKNLFYGGIILSVAGILLTILTYTGAIVLGRGTHFIVAYGPITLGLITAFTGWSKMNRS